MINGPQFNQPRREPNLRMDQLPSMDSITCVNLANGLYFLKKEWHDCLRIVRTQNVYTKLFFYCQFKIQVLCNYNSQYMISFASVMSLTNPFVFFFLRRKNRPDLENGLTLKTLQMFSLHTTLKAFDKRSYLRLVFEENLDSLGNHIE